MLFSRSQLADLGFYGPRPGVKMAQGNVYNALLYQGNTSSEIDNISTGNGNDTVIGNDVYNHITLGNGSDSVTAGAAGAYIVCGTGTDTINTGTAACVIKGGTGTAILDYSGLSGYLIVDLQNGTVDKPGAQDAVTNVQVFDGGSGGNAFKSIDIGDYTFNGQGYSIATYNGQVGANTLDYSADANGVTINLATDTVTKGIAYISWQSGAVHWQDSFSDILGRRHLG